MTHHPQIHYNFIRPKGRPEDEALDSLRILSAALVPAKLKRLNLSDNALGEKGVRACAEVRHAQFPARSTFANMSAESFSREAVCCQGPLHV